MDNEYLLNFFKKKNVPIIQKKRHTYLTYYGLEQQDTYVLEQRRKLDSKKLSLDKKSMKQKKGANKAH